MAQDVSADEDAPIPSSGKSEAVMPSETDRDELADNATAQGPTERAIHPSRWRRLRVNQQRVLAFGVLPVLALLLAVGAGYLKWVDGAARAAELARIESVQAATESTIAMLSYQPDNVDKQLPAARERLTGAFRDSYTSLINDVVIPGAKQQRVSAQATVPAAASVSATADHAVVLVFVDQTTTIGDAAPNSTASSVKVTLDKVGPQWLISDFTPL
jgi:Mce-associated membrane protein